jgi:hypothetical protein
VRLVDGRVVDDRPVEKPRRVNGRTIGLVEQLTEAG